MLHYEERTIHLVYTHVYNSLPNIPPNMSVGLTNVTRSVEVDAVGRARYNGYG